MTRVLSDSAFDAGVFYVVATPIGNLADISLRALQILAEADVVYAEDTRTTRKLFSYHGIQQTLKSLHEHNEQQKIDEIKDSLNQGAILALVSDAGTPLISDPGFQLVRELVTAKCSVVPVPGASALIAAMSVSGLPTDCFTFRGFLSAKKTLRKKQLKAVSELSETQVFYESSHRIKSTLEMMSETLGYQREVCIARELTKLYEQYFRGSLQEAMIWLEADSNHCKGEFVVIVSGAPTQKTRLSEQSFTENQVLEVMLGELSVKQAASLTSKLFGTNKNALYRQAMALQKDIET